MADVKYLFKELADEVNKILEARINKYGINPKTGTNTLQGSNLERSIEVNTFEYGLALKIVDYWEFVSRGWKRTHNYPNTMAGFVYNVTQWVRRKNIRFGNMSESQIVFIIIRNIMNEGLKARPFMVYNDEGDLTEMIPELKEYINEWFDRLFDAILEDINTYFNP